MFRFVHVFIVSPTQSLNNFKICLALQSEAYYSLMLFGLLCQVEHCSQVDHLVGFI